MIDLTKAIATAVKTGKVSFGANTAIQTAKNGKAKMIVIASNCPKQIKEQIKHYGEISKIPIITYQGDTMDMAAVCNKLFVISALTIRETGDSEILKIVNNDNGDKNIGGG
jgi:large subunit ribosomal protein L30e